MNFLAHAYLSFNDPEILLGNLISDFVKGRKKYDYPHRILAGIDLHRAIDAFTDTHTTVKRAAKVFKAAYGLYSSAMIDVVYDHFLAMELVADGSEAFLKFTEHVYNTASQFTSIFPEKFRNIFPHMKAQNWLYNYQFFWGIEKSFLGLVHRAAYLTSSEPAMRIFVEEYELLKESYHEFFPQLRDFSLRKFADIH